MYNFDHTNVYSNMLYSKCVLCGLHKKINPYSFEIKLKKWINNDRIVILFSPVLTLYNWRKSKYNNSLDSLA